MLQVIALIGLLACSARPQQAAQQPAPVQRFAEEDDSIANSTYRNRYFGLNLAIPAGWTADSFDTRAAAHDAYATGTIPGVPPKKVQSPKSGLTVFSMHPSSKPSMLVMLSVIDVSSYEDIQRPEDITIPLMDQLKGQGARITNTAAPLLLAGATFSRFDSTLVLDGSTAYQSTIVTIRKRHAVVFTLTATSEDDIRTEVGTLKALKFDPERSIKR